MPFARTLRGIAGLMAALPLFGQPEPLAPQAWQDDLAVLARELPARHIQAFARIERSDFEARVAALKSRIPALSEAQIQTEFTRLVAALGDGHTGISWSGRTKQTRLPISLYWFRDGIFVVAAAPEYRQLLGARVARLGGATVEEACRRLTPLVPRENDAWLKVQLPVLLTMANFLEGTGVAESGASVRVQAVTREGATVTADIAPVAAGSSQRQVRWEPARTPVLGNSNRAYWATTVDAGATVYFQYNRCVDDPQRPFADFAADLERLLASDGVRRIVVDLRANGGGSSAVLTPWIRDIRVSPFNSRGRLYVLVGRRTFSAAILNAVSLSSETAATVAGEPTGGKPNHFGEVRWFVLPNSGARVSYSTKHFQFVKEDTPSLVPDLVVETTSEDYHTGFDPVLEAILRSPAPSADDALRHWQDAHRNAAPASKPTSTLRQQYEARFAKDRARYTAAQFAEIEKLYQVANEHRQSDEARESLLVLVAKYPGADRTGCALVYLAQMSSGVEREQYLKAAIADYSDSMYGDLVQVGALARVLLAEYYTQTGEGEKAQALRAEVRRDYPDAVDHSGHPLQAVLPE